MFKPISKLLLNDLDLFSITEKNYQLVKNLPKPFSLIASSHGIYFAFALAYLYPKIIKNIVSLDGSWITSKLCKLRLSNWKKNNKIVKSITSQQKLDDIMSIMISIKK